MNKVWEYLIVSVVAIAAFVAMVGIFASTAQDIIVKDCERMGQSRQGKVLLKCEVVQ